MTRSDEALMRAYADGERAAVVELLVRFAPVAARRLRVEGSSEALLPEVFVQLHRARRDFRGGMSLDAWIDNIALNLARATKGGT